MSSYIILNIMYIIIIYYLLLYVMIITCKYYVVNTWYIYLLCESMSSDRCRSSSQTQIFSTIIHDFLTSFEWISLLRSSSSLLSYYISLLFSRHVLLFNILYYVIYSYNYVICHLI